MRKWRSSKINYLLLMPCLGLVLFAIGYTIKERREPPKSPKTSFGLMIGAMRNGDKSRIKMIATTQMVNTLSNFHGEAATQIYVYDYLKAKGANDSELKQRWGLWKKWAAQVDLRKIEVIANDRSGNKITITSGDPDGLYFIWFKQGADWILGDWSTSASSSMKDQS